VSLATGPKTNSPRRAAAARREQRLCCPCPRPLQTVVVTRTAAERINDERQRAAPPIGQDALAVRQKSRQRVLRAEKAMASRSRRRLGTSAFRSRCAAGPAILWRQSKQVRRDLLLASTWLRYSDWTVHTSHLVSMRAGVECPPGDR
jgi:hypothetical protein